jgi:pimeloyl-ACP methyl ester carboxylesterase
MILTGCADRLLLYPTREPIDASGATRREISVSGGVLEVWVARSSAGRSAETQAYVLEFTGNATRAERVCERDARLWDPRPVEVWAVNYPGYGGSSGKASLAAIAPAALVAYDGLAQYAGKRPIYVSGTSLGTAAALHVAAHRPAAGLVLRNPPAIRQIILGQYGWWNLWLLAGPLALSIPPELDSIANATAVRAPAVFLLADRDEVVPPRYQQKVVRTYAGPKRTIAMVDCNHNTPLDDQAIAELRSGVDWMMSAR